MKIKLYSSAIFAGLCAFFLLSPGSADAQIAGPGIGEEIIVADWNMTWQFDHIPYSQFYPMTFEQGTVNYMHFYGQVEAPYIRTDCASSGEGDGSRIYGYENLYFGTNIGMEVRTGHSFGPGVGSSVYSVNLQLGSSGSGDYFIRNQAVASDVACDDYDPNHQFERLLYWMEYQFDITGWPVGDYRVTFPVGDPYNGYWEGQLLFTITNPCRSVSINSNIPIPWSLSGPRGYSAAQNSANFTANNTPTGQYTLSYPNSINVGGTDYSINGHPINPQTCNGDGNIVFDLSYSAGGSPTPPPPPGPTPPGPTPPGPTPPGPTPPGPTPPGPTPPPGSCNENAALSFVTPPPATVAPGQPYSFTVLLTNNGDVKYAHGTWWRLSDNGTAGSYWTNGGYFNNLPMQNTGANNPGESNTLTVNAVAPTAVGNYQIGMQMLHLRSVAPYDTAINPSCPAGTGPDHFFGQLLTANINVAVTLGTVTVTTTGVPGTWRITGSDGSGTFLDNQQATPTAGPITYQGNVGSYNLTNYNIPGYNATVSPSASQSINSAGQSISFNINYTPQSGTVSASASIPSGSWQVLDQSGTVIRSGSGTAVDTFPLTVGNYSFKVLPSASYLIAGVRKDGVLTVPGALTNGDTLPFTLNNGVSTTLIGEYNQPAPPAPDMVQLDPSPCGQLKFSWRDNSTNETGYELSYSTAPNDPNPTVITTVGSVAGSGTRGSYTWSSPPAVPAWVSVRAYITYGGTNVYSSYAYSSSSYTPQTCYPSLSSSSKSIYRVNNAAYNPAVSGQDGDILTFRIIIQNNGTDIAQVTGITDTLHPNLRDDGRDIQLVMPAGGWNVRIDKDADGNFNEAGETATTSYTAPDLTINISGVKCTTNNNTGCTSATDPSCVTTPVPYCNNWVIYFDAQVQVTVPNVRTDVWNQATLRYNYPVGGGAASPVQLFSPRYLINSPQPGIPDIREVTP